MRFLVVLLLFIGLSGIAEAAEALSGDTIKLDDGRIVRLLGIKGVGNAARERLQALVAQQEPVLAQSATPDRYGRLDVDAYIQPTTGEKLWLQGTMLHEGLAFVYPPTGTEPRLADLLTAEHEARAARSGIWSETSYDDLPADNPKRISYGHFSFVSGKVVKASRVKNMFYLNFGANWRDDFTVAIAAHDLHVFDAANIDPLTYQSKIIRVRGWVKRDFGPMIMVTTPAQIEILGEALPKP